MVRSPPLIATPDWGDDHLDLPLLWVTWSNFVIWQDNPSVISMENVLVWHTKNTQVHPVTCVQRKMSHPWDDWLNGLSSVTAASLEYYIFLWLVFKINVVYGQQQMYKMVQVQGTMSQLYAYCMQQHALCKSSCSKKCAIWNAAHDWSFMRMVIELLD